MLSYQDLVVFLLPLITGGLGWWVKALRSDLDQNRQDLHALAIKVAEEYVSLATLGDIRATLLRIETKLDTKQDKE